MQPWSFVVVSDSEVKRQIRKEAEKAEGEFYNKKTNLKWVEELKPLGTNKNKPFLEIATLSHRYLRSNSWSITGWNQKKPLLCE